MKRRICVALALMIALMLSVCAIADELTYNGEEQPLVSAQGAWLYSLDGENYSEDIPTAVDAGEYTVYFKAEADADAEILTVTVAKADVTVIPPVAAYIEEL